MELQEVGNCVKVGATLIPAVNIQVEGVPGFIQHGDTKFWYGVYFEILFETGALWVVEQGGKQEYTESVMNSVMIQEYPRWGVTESLDHPGVFVVVESWEAFLGLYEEKKRIIRSWQ